MSSRDDPLHNPKTATPITVRPSISFGKRIIFILLTALLTGLFFEIVSYTYLAVRYPAPNAAAAEPSPRDDASMLPSWHEPQVIHPYLGYVKNLDSAREDRDDLGFNGRENHIQKRAPDKIIIGIFGGSVAQRLHVNNKYLESELRRSGYFANKQIIFLNFAMAGYKQPQQLMALTYIRALGGELDIAINLDGFNEIYLPAQENIPKGVFPFFPRAWDMRVGADSRDTGELVIIARIVMLREERERLDRVFARAPLKYSATLRLVGKALNTSLENRLTRLRTALIEYKKSGAYQYAPHGPSFSFKNADELYRKLAVFWQRCSTLMQVTCRAQNIKYFHFLQPNQYVPGSKKFGPAELKTAYSEKLPMRNHVLAGYPYLKKSGERLKEKGEAFTDLSMAFANIEEPLYEDASCHFGPRGYEILAPMMAREIIGVMEAADRQSAATQP